MKKKKRRYRNCHINATCGSWLHFIQSQLEKKNLSDDLDNFNTDWIFDDINLFRYANVIKTIFIKSPYLLQIHWSFYGWDAMMSGSSFKITQCQWWPCWGMCTRKQVGTWADGCLSWWCLNRCSLYTSLNSCGCLEIPHYRKSSVDARH